MRIARALAAAALAVGLASTLAPAEAAPAAPPVVQVVHAPVQAKAAKAKTKVTTSTPKKVKGGQTFKIKATLKIKTADGYKPYAKKKLVLVTRDQPGSPVLDEKKTDKDGKVTFKFDTDKDMAGETVNLFVAYEGGSKAKGSSSDILHVKVTK